MDGWINVALGSKILLLKPLNPKLLNGSVNLPIKKKTIINPFFSKQITMNNLLISSSYYKT